MLQSLLQGDEKGALDNAGRLQEIFGKDNLFVELQDHGLQAQRDTNPKLIEIARKIGAPLIATNDSHYVHREDHEAHDALLCVQTGATLSDPKRFKFEGQEHYLKTSAEMRYLFRDFPEACDNTLWIAERADVNIEFGKPQLPDFPIAEGFRRRCQLPRPPHVGGCASSGGATSCSPSVVERLAYELQVIKNMGFASYFLIVWDLIKHAKDAGIRVGPGRGSAAGCAVAYCLRITDLDPIKYDLLFERFLNPSRISMPDIDMDFDSRYRDEMIRYAAEKYGRDHVAQIITFGTIKARNAVRDAARVLGYPVRRRRQDRQGDAAAGDGSRHAAEVLLRAERRSTLDGYKAASELRAMCDADPDVKRVVDVAKGLEGLKRSDGIHAAAVVITKEPLTSYLPIQRKPEAGGRPEDAPVVTQYEMHGVEDLGLLKMDFLGLRNLDVISDTVEMVRVVKDPEFDIDTVPLDDQTVFDLIGSRRHDGRVPARVAADARAAALARADQLRATSSAVLALYRPGPMSVNMHYDYADRKNGRQPVELLPRGRQGGARRHLRPDDLSGERHARRAEVRRVLAGRSRQPAQGDGQEVPRGHGRGARRVRGRLRATRLRPGARQAAVRRHRASSPTTPSTRATRSATASSRTRRRTSRRTTRSSTSPACCPASRATSTRPPSTSSDARGDGHQGADARHQPLGHGLRHRHARRDRRSR